MTIETEFIYNIQDAKLTKEQLQRIGEIDGVWHIDDEGQSGYAATVRVFSTLPVKTEIAKAIRGG